MTVLAVLFHEALDLLRQRRGNSHRPRHGYRAPGAQFAHVPLGMTTLVNA